LVKQVADAHHVWNRQLIIIGLPLIITLAFGFGLAQMQLPKTKAQQITPSASSPQSLPPAVESSKSLPMLPFAPSKKLPSVTSSSSIDSNSSQTATPQPAAQTTTNLQAAATGSQPTSPSNSQQDLPQVLDVLHSIRNINTQPLNISVTQNLL